MCAKPLGRRRKSPAAVAAAALGGITPNLMGLAILLTKETAELPQYTYFLGLAIFALLGGAVCLFWREIDPKRAFYLGLGLPSIIQIGIGDISRKPVPESRPAEIMEPVVGGIGMRFRLTSTALARGEVRGFARVETSTWPGRKILIEIDRPFFAGTPIANQLAVLYDEPNERSATPIQVAMLRTFVAEQNAGGRAANRSSVLQLDVPEAAVAFRIQVGTQYSQRMVLPTTPRQAVLYRLRYIEDRWSGFRQAIGQRSASTYSIELNSQGPAPFSFDNHAKFIEKRERYNWFRWETFVDANQAQLERIVKVEYKLHSSFAPQPPATDRSKKFALAMEGWGSFWVHAIVYYADGRQTQVQYFLDLRKA
jgi:hypothetical protein